ncbi:hypothetical protein ACFVYT_40870 [Streptomyces sp. NPDC058290]|uniref:hypothetical protein n=1 Tax=Streptomyces sp. NPDC058290 TaxID=3346426 RepID=UPI0036ED9E62
MPAVKEAANRHLGIAVPVETVAGSWLNAADMDDRQGLWVLLFGAFAVFVIAVSIVVSNLAEFVRFSRQITALSVLSGNPDHLRRAFCHCPSALARDRTAATRTDQAVGVPGRRSSPWPAVGRVFCGRRATCRVETSIPLRRSGIS